jgi:hypothetical protein
MPLIYILYLRFFSTKYGNPRFSQSKLVCMYLEKSLLGYADFFFSKYAGLTR